MPRTCTICTHNEKEAINQALVDGKPFAAIAAKYRVSQDAVGRHKAKHLPALLVKAQEAEEVSQADDLLEQARDLQERALAILDKAEERGNYKVALQAIRESRGVLELLAKLLGEIETQQTINITVNPQWINLRTIILEEIEPYPEAKTALIKRISAIEGGN